MILQEDRAAPKIRAKLPKVKTGCKTCKIRKVKCDEAKPICVRCVKFGVDCDGYAQNIRPPKRPILPREQKLNPAFQSAEYAPLCNTLCRALFASEQENRYFQIFSSQTALRLSGLFSSTLWQTLVLQACETEPSICHAVIALGALDFTSCPSSKFQNESSTLRHQFAFQEYNKAISHIRRRISMRKVGAQEGATHDIRIALIACLIFSCFEAFHGFADQAIAHIYSGVKMIEEWLQQPNHTIGHLSCISSPRPTIIEDELLQAFARLQLEAMTRQDSRSPASHKAFRYFGQISMDIMPAKFTNLAEAKAYQDLVGRRAMHWAASMEGKDEFNGVLSLQNMGIFQEHVTICSERNKILAEFESWAEAFEPLWILSRRDEGKAIFKGATLLRLHLLGDYLCKYTVACNKDIYYGRFTRELREIISLAKILLEDQEYTSTDFGDGDKNLSYNFDVQVCLPLMTVGLKYRHRTLRREAIDLLLRWPRRDGIWDSWVIGKTMQWLADVEDEELASEEEEKHVPEERVVKMVQMLHNDAERKTTVSCLQPVWGIEGNLIPRQVIIPWL